MFAEIKGASSKSSSDEAVEITEKILAMPAEERSCKKLLTDGKLRHCRMWRWSTLNRPRTPYPFLKDFASYIWTRRCLEILGYEMKILSPVSDIERRFAVTSMSNAKVNMPQGAEALKKYRGDISKKRLEVVKRKKTAGQSSKPVLPEHVYTSSSDTDPAKKKAKVDSAIVRGKQVIAEPKRTSTDPTLELDSSTILLASGLSSFDEPTEWLKKADGLLLPADDSHLKKRKTEEVFDTTILSSFQVTISVEECVYMCFVCLLMVCISFPDPAGAVASSRQI